MQLLAPMPFDAAVAQLDKKTPVGSRLRTAGWAQMPLAFRERGFFTAGVENLRTVSEMKNKLRDAFTLADNGRMNRANFVSEMRKFMGAPEGDSGQLTDITSVRRLQLIYDHNTESAFEYGRWVTGQNPAILDAFPAQELVRQEERVKPRVWEERWKDAGGLFFGGRMIALKTDPIWEAISRFGTPWPPFDFNSGMGIEDISRADAEELGLLEPGEPVAPILQDFNARLEASLPDGADAALLGQFKEIFGDQIAVSDGRIRWVPDAVGKLYDTAVADSLAGKNPAGKIDLGIATPRAVDVCKRDLGVDATGWRLQVQASDLAHPIENHGLPGLLGVGEKLPDQVPLTRDDFRAIPLIWRAPDKAVAAPKNNAWGDQPPDGWPGSIRLQSNIAGQLWIADYYVDTANKLLGFKTGWRKKP